MFKIGDCKSLLCLGMANQISVRKALVQTLRRLTRRVGCIICYDSGQSQTVAVAGVNKSKQEVVKPIKVSPAGQTDSALSASAWRDNFEILLRRDESYSDFQWLPPNLFPHPVRHTGPGTTLPSHWWRAFGGPVSHNTVSLNIINP